MIIRNKKKTSVRKKVSALTTMVSFASVLIVGLITLISLFVLRGNIYNIGGQLVFMEEEVRLRTLERFVNNRQEVLAINRAAMCDSLLLIEQRKVEAIALRATEILQNPDRYMANPVPPPDPVNAGIYSAQFIRAETNVDLDAINRESSLLGNIQNILFDIHLNTNGQSAFIASELGYVITVDNVPDLKPEFADARERPAYILTKEKNSVSWTDYYEEMYGRHITVVCTAPFYDANNNFAGIAGVFLILDDIAEIAAMAMIGENGYAFILDNNGQEVIVEGHIPMVSEAAALVIKGQNGSELIKMNDGREFITAYAPLKIVPWTFITAIYANEYITLVLESRNNIIHMRDVASRRIENVIIIVVIMLITLLIISPMPLAFVSKKFSNTLTKPITTLSDGVRLIENGNLDHIININSGDEIEDLGASVNKMAIGLKEYIFNLQKVTAEKERIKAELEVAARIQASMLPCIFPAFPHQKDFDIYATMKPAKEVGGDFYDFFMIDDNTLAVVIADVSGKGVPAALFMVIAKTLIKNNAQQGKNLVDVFETVNRQLYENNDECMFVTVFMGYLDIPSGKFNYINAGHNPPLIKHRDADFQWLPVKPGLVLGGFENVVYEQYEITLNHGDMLYLYTDGVTEAMNPEMKLFTDLRLLKSSNKYKNLNLADFLNGIKSDVDIFSGDEEQADDITMLVLKYMDLK